MKTGVSIHIVECFRVGACFCIYVALAAAVWAQDPARRVALVSYSIFQVEGAPGPSLLGTGEEEPNCRMRIHSGSCQPLSRAVHSDSISTIPRIPV
jgi:hypothetical protein